MKAKSALMMVMIVSMIMAGCSINIGCGPNAWRSSTESAERDDHVSASMTPGQALSVDTNFGGITVRGADVETCEVQAHVRAQASTQERADALLSNVTVVLEPRGNGLFLHVDKPSLGNNESVGVSFDVVLPRQVQLECSTSHAQIRVEQTEGSIKAKTSFGSVHCENVMGDLELRTSHGQINMQDVQASQIKADTSFGGVHLACKDADTPPARIFLKTSHGSIEAENIRTRELEANTSFGSVSIAYASDGPEDLAAKLSSSHGSLSLTPPLGFKGTVELSTSHGSINLDRPVTVQGNLSKDRISGTLGNGTGSIRMNTSFASIKLH